MSGVALALGLLGADLDCPVLPVDLRPVEAEDLPVADAAEAHEDDGGEDLVGAGGQEGGDLVGGQDHGLFAPDLHAGGVPDRIGGDYPGFDGEAEEVGEDPAEVHLGLRGDRQGEDPGADLIPVDRGDGGFPKVPREPGQSVLEVGIVALGDPLPLPLFEEALFHRGERGGVPVGLGFEVG